MLLHLESDIIKIVSMAVSLLPQKSSGLKCFLSTVVLVRHRMENNGREVSPLPGDAGSIPSLCWPCDTQGLIHFSEARKPDDETRALFLFPCGLRED